MIVLIPRNLDGTKDDLQPGKLDTLHDPGPNKEAGPRRSGRGLRVLIPLVLIALAGGWFLFGGRKDIALPPPIGSQGGGQNTKVAEDPPCLEPARATATLDEMTAKELQQVWACYLGREVVEEHDLGDNVKLKVVLIPPGTFLMGSKAGEKRTKMEEERTRTQDEMQRDVEITRPFYLGRCEVTQEQYQQLMKKNPSKFSADGTHKDKVKGADTKQFPVENLSWEDAVKFCDILGEKVGRKVRLPSEAQWEYACRAGTSLPFHFGESLKGTQANLDGKYPYGTNEVCQALERPCEVGKYPANAWGLHDMHGNVREWCADAYDSYARLPDKDPLRTNAGSGERVFRGGSWNDTAMKCRAAFRDRIIQDSHVDSLGFRICVLVD